MGSLVVVLSSDFGIGADSLRSVRVPCERVVGIGSRLCPLRLFLYQQSFSTPP